MGYFYLYDQKYYLNYLDYLFEAEREERSYGNRRSNGEGTSATPPSRYYPHSNYLILELSFKFVIASTTIIMFEYKPQLWVFPVLFAMMVCFVRIKVFQVYERLAMLCYLVGFLVYLLSIAIFFVDYFFNVWVIIIAVISSAGFFVLLISDLSDWSRAKEGKYWAVAFEDVNNTDKAND